MTMRHPETSLGHEAVIETLTETISDAKASTNEKYLAEMLLDIYRATCTHPAVVDIINRYALRAVERNDQDGHQ